MCALRECIIAYITVRLKTYPNSLKSLYKVTISLQRLLYSELEMCDLDLTSFDAAEGLLVSMCWFGLFDMTISGDGVRN